MIATAFTILALLIGAAGAWIDIRKRLLPNVLCMAMAIACAAHVFANLGAEGLLSSAVHALIALLIGAALFAMRWIGGGDAKFYASAALAAPLSQAVTLLFWTSIAGLVLVTIIYLQHRIKPPRSSTNEERESPADVPLGVAIFAGFAATVIPNL